MNGMEVFEAPMNIGAERIVIGTILTNNWSRGMNTDYALTYLDKNWFCSTFCQDIFVAMRVLNKQHKEINKNNVAQYIVEHDMGRAEVVYRDINSFNEHCTEENIFWEFIKLLERLYWERQQQRLLLYIANCRGVKNG